MEKLSTDFKKPKEAIEALSGLDSEEDVSIFITGEERKEILSAADARIKELSALSSPPSASKQGELRGDITQKTSDFKEGVQGTKDADPSRITDHASRSYVTCEDVISAMRKAGKKI